MQRKANVITKDEDLVKESIWDIEYNGETAAHHG